MSKQYDIANISDVFNKNIKKLLIIISNSIDNNDILFDTIKRRTLLIIKSHPLLLLEQGGCEIFKYRDYIKNDLEELFLRIDDEIMTHKQMQEYINDNNNENNKENILQLIKKIKEIWNKYNNDEKKAVNNIFKILLSEYCKYLTLQN